MLKRFCVLAVGLLLGLGRSSAETAVNLADIELVIDDEVIIAPAR